MAIGTVKKVNDCSFYINFNREYEALPAIHLLMDTVLEKIYKNPNISFNIMYYKSCVISGDMLFHAHMENCDNSKVSFRDTGYTKTEQGQCRCCLSNPACFVHDQSRK